MPARKSTRRTKSASTASAQTTSPMQALPDTQSAYQVSKTGFDAAVKLTNAVLEGFEHIREMQLNTARQAHDKNNKIANDLLRIRAPADLAKLEMDWTRLNMEQASQYWRDMYSLSSAMNAKLLEEMKNEWFAANKELGQATAKMMKPAEQKVMPTMTPMASPDNIKLAMDMTNATLTSFTKAASDWMDSAKQSLQNGIATRH